MQIFAPFGIAKKATKQLSFMATWNTGGQYNVTGNTNWSSNKTRVATVGTTTNTNRGLVTAVNPESVSMAALFGNEPYGAGYICLGNGGCPMASFGDTTGGTVDDFNLALRIRSGRAAPRPKIARCTQQG